MRPPRNPLASWSLSLISRDAVLSAMPVGLTTRVPVVDEVSLAKEETIPHVREVSCHLLHPLPFGSEVIPPMHTQRVAISMTNRTW